jgi:hypothetical protein
MYYLIVCRSWELLVAVNYSVNTPLGFAALESVHIFSLTNPRKFPMSSSFPI